MRKFNFLFPVLLMFVMTLSISCKKDKCNCSSEQLCFNCLCADKDCKCNDRVQSFLNDFRNNSEWSGRGNIKLKVVQSNMTLTNGSNLSKSMDEIDNFVVTFEYSLDEKTGYFGEIKKGTMYYGISGQINTDKTIRIKLPTGEEVNLSK